MTGTTPEQTQVIACTPAWMDERHPDWIALSARFLSMINASSGRTDLLVNVSPDTENLYQPDQSTRPIASFVPALAEVRLTANRVWSPTNDDPARIDPNNASDRAQYPAMMGVMAHEAGHAAHTRIEFPRGTSPAVAHWATVLEEPRMEAQQVRRRPQDRQWLRASALELAAGGALTLTRDGADAAAPSTAMAVRSAVLFLGRAAGGVLTDTECATLRAETIAVIGVEAMATVDAALDEVMSLADGDTEGLCRVAEDLVALCTPDEDERDESSGDPGEQDESSGEQGDPDGEDSEGEGSGDQQGEGTGSGSATDDRSESEAHQMPCGSWTNGDLPDDTDPWQAPAADPAKGDEPRLTNAIKATAETIAEDAAESVRAAQFPASPPGKTPREQRREAQTRDRIAAAVAQCGSDRHPITVVSRAPDAALRASVRSMTAALRRAQFRGTKRDKVPSLAPPGRMRMAGVMRQQAQREARVRVTAKPFAQTRRRVVDNPPLTVGFTGDVSGSMQAAQRAVADLSWVLAQSVTFLSGRVAATAWNQQAVFTLDPQKAPSEVPEAVCGGGSGGCAVAIDALDGALHLADGSGARMLVVVTDGFISGGDQITHNVARLVEAGVHVLWVSVDPRGWSPAGVHRVDVDLSEQGQFSQVVGDAIVTMLNRS